MKILPPYWFIIYVVAGELLHAAWLYKGGFYHPLPWLGAPPFFLAALALFLTLKATFIPYEEKKMEETFGEAYQQYQRQVRRWL